MGYPIPGSGPLPYSGQSRIAALRESDGTLLWSVADTNGTGQLAYADGVLLLFGRSTVALRARDGVPLWHALSSNFYGNLPPPIAGGVLYVIHDGVYAFRIADGRKLWQIPVPADQALTEPVVDGATVFVGSSNGFVMALQADTGALLWKTFPTYPAPVSVSTPADGGTYTPFGVVAGQLYVRASGAATVGLVRMNAADGASATYDLPLPARTLFVGNPVLIVNGMLVVGVADITSISSAPTEFVAFRLLAVGGTPLWQVTANGLVLTLLAYDAQTLYLQDGGTDAVRVADGAILWRQGITFGRNRTLAKSAAVDTSTAVLLEAAPGVVDYCSPLADQPPQLGAFTGADGSALWTHALDATL